MAKKLFFTGTGLIFILLTGTFGYWYLTGQKYPLFDCFYLTVITITTIGYSEVIDQGHYPNARILTIFIAFAGIGLLTYFVTSISALVIEGHLKQSYRKRKMENAIRKLENHFIICGIGRHSVHLMEELTQTHRESVFIDINTEIIEKILKKYPDELFIEGDATNDDILLKAGIMEARGLFATTTDDNLNLVVCLSAKRLNPELTIVALCNNHNNLDKLKLAGADKIVSTYYISGMRMASEMFRPTVTEVLDVMLRGKNKFLRIEQVEIHKDYFGKKIHDLRIAEFKNTLLIALRNGDEIQFNPDPEMIINNGDAIIVMTTPQERIKLENLSKS
ncbi:MAG: potassium channel protein [Bacteroidetes bacterium]|nr:potassium channel protein [Bacteroidota bacterium]